MLLPERSCEKLVGAQSKPWPWVKCQYSTRLTKYGRTPPASRLRLPNDVKEEGGDRLEYDPWSWNVNCPLSSRLQLIEKAISASVGGWEGVRHISSSVNFPTRPDLEIYGLGLDDAEGLELERFRI